MFPFRLYFFPATLFSLLELSLQKFSPETHHNLSSFTPQDIEFLNTVTTEHLVFLYGTLKKGEPNHHWLLKTANGRSQFIGSAETVDRYPVVIATRYNMPFLLYKRGVGHIISGEVYLVNTKMLSHLDNFLQHPILHVRVQEPVRYKNQSNADEPIKCWIYSVPFFKPELLDKPMHSDYHSAGEHGLTFDWGHELMPTYNYHNDVLAFNLTGMFSKPDLDLNQTHSTFDGDYQLKTESISEFSKNHPTIAYEDIYDIEYVFAFGLLKGNGSKHFLFENKTKYGEAKLIFGARSLYKYPLYIDRDLEETCILYRPGMGQRIVGDIYEVNDQMILTLDLVEAPEAWRRVIKFHYLDQLNISRPFEGWLYFNDKCSQSFTSAVTHGDYWPRNSTIVDFSRKYYRQIETIARKHHDLQELKSQPKGTKQSQRIKPQYPNFTSISSGIKDKLNDIFKLPFPFG